MKKILLSFLLIGLSFNAISQNIHACAESKMIAHSKQGKKSRASAYANSLMSQYDVHFYFLDMNAERTTTVISGATTIGAVVTSALLDTFCFELNPNLVIDSVVYNNQNLTVNRVAAVSYAVFPTPVVQNTNIYIKIYYHGDAYISAAAAIGDGFSTGTSPTWGNKVTWSLSEPYSAYEWFPCKQFLQDKADSAWIFVTTDSANRVGSNGLLEGIDNMPNNKLRYRWKTHYVIDYYLISVAIAKYIDYTIYAHPASLPNDSIPIVNYVYNNPATLTSFKDDIDSMPMVLEYYSELFGLYPFYKEKYGHCMAPLGGGMEHQTMTTIGNLGNFSTNAHELMHQWWGNHVTCKTWKDIFINEGFASYGEYLAFDQFRSHVAAQEKMFDVHFEVLKDPVAKVFFTDTTDVGRIFDSRLTYDKGSAVVHTLRFVLGDSLFFKGLREFQQNFSFFTASIADLKSSLETSTGKNLSDYFSQWLYGEGYPTYSAEYASDSSYLYIKVNHVTSSTATPLFKTPLEIKFNYVGGDTILRVDITQNSNLFIFPTDKIITNLTFDPNNWILNKVGSITENANLIPLANSAFALENKIFIYPNPTADHLQIESTFDQADFILYDLSGRIMQQGEINRKVNIDISYLSSGTYIIEVQTSLGKMKRKLTKL